MEAGVYGSGIVAADLIRQALRRREKPKMNGSSPFDGVY
jgi:hypothetical protein